MFKWIYNYDYVSITCFSIKNVTKISVDGYMFSMRCLASLFFLYMQYPKKVSCIRNVTLYRTIEFYHSILYYFLVICM